MLSVFYLIIFTWETSSLQLISDYGFFSLLGLSGALVANATGAGGGVVFIPFFAALGITPMQCVATSMAIQSCGMTAGALSWLHSLNRQYQANEPMLWMLKQLIVLTSIATISGMLLGQYVVTVPGFELASAFSGFSVSFGILLLIFIVLERYRRRREQTTLKTAQKRSTEPHQDITTITPVLTSGRKITLTITCVLGGMVTAWISVGVGEFVALLLFFLRFPTNIAVAIGVVTSSIAVLTGLVYHLVVQFNVIMEIVLFAGQAALIGGYLARHITKFLGAERLKIFFAVWIIVTGLFMK